MAELVDAADSKSAGGNTMGVRFPLPAPRKNPRKFQQRPKNPFFSYENGFFISRVEQDAKGRELVQQIADKIDGKS